MIDVDNHQPLIGANVIIDGSDIGAACDDNGGFQIKNIPVGSYTVTVLDDRGCSASDSRNIDSVTGNMQASTSVTNVSCFGLFDGSTFVDNVDSMVPFNNNPLNDPLDPPYTFSWTYPNGAIVTQNQINYLYAGNYGVTITDSNNCSITIYTDVQEPDQLEYTLYDITASTCYGACNGSISVDVQGGTSPYSYDFDEIGTFPFLNPVPLINDSLILDLCAEDYDIYVTDANDCIGTVVWGGVWQATIDSAVVNCNFIPGCTDPIACNYDSTAIIDDSSCIYISNPIVNMTSGSAVWTWDWSYNCDSIIDASYSMVFYPNGTVSSAN